MDLERLGKAARQAGCGAWLSGHREQALPALAAELRTAALFARCDPPHSGTPGQVERLLTAGVRVLMLPMYRTLDEVRQFADAVAGRARTVLLVETRQAAGMVTAAAAVPGIDELHVGLNDLAMSVGLSSRFAVLASPLLDAIAAEARTAGLPLGVGGVARVADRTLPVAPELLYARLAQLGAGGTLLSRAFLDGEDDLVADVRAARALFADWRRREPGDQARALARLRRQATGLVEWDGPGRIAATG